MSIYSDLLFHQGHIADVALAQSLAATPKAQAAPADTPAAAPAQAPDAAGDSAATRALATARNHRARALLRRTMTALSPFR